MGADWAVVCLGDILTPCRIPAVLEDDATYEQVTVAIKGRGLRRRGIASGSEIKTKRQFRISPNQLLVSKIDARNGAIGIVPPELDGAIVSGDFPVFDVNDKRCTPAYLDLYVKRPAFWDECHLVSEGSTNRVRLVPEQFLDLEVELPPLSEQQAIMAAAQVAAQAGDAWKREASAMIAVLVALRSGLFAEFDVVRVDELLADIQGGKSPKAVDRPPANAEPAVLKVSSIRPGEFRPNEAKVLESHAEMPAHAKVRRGDLLVNRASGSLALLCSACLVDKDVEHLYLSDKTLRLVPAQGINARCLMEALALPVSREQIEMEGEGTSGAKNVGQNDIREFEVPWPPDQVSQRLVVERTMPLRTAARLAQRSSSAVASFRAALIEELVTGVRAAPALDV